MSRWAKVNPKERDEFNSECRRLHAERLAEWRAMKMEKVEVVGAGDDDECPACARLVAKGVMPLSEAPHPLPPSDCTCVPWCRCVMTVTE